VSEMLCRTRAYCDFAVIGHVIGHQTRSENFRKPKDWSLARLIDILCHLGVAPLVILAVSVIGYLIY